MLLKISICHFTGYLRTIKRKVSSLSIFNMWTSSKVFMVLDTKQQANYVMCKGCEFFFLLCFSACLWQISPELVNCDHKNQEAAVNRS